MLAAWHVGVHRLPASEQFEQHHSKAVDVTLLSQLADSRVPAVKCSATKRKVQHSSAEDSATKEQHVTADSLYPSLPHAITQSLVKSLTHTHSLTHSHTHTLTHSLTHSLAHSLTHTLTHSLTHSHTNTLTHTLTHSLTHSLRGIVAKGPQHSRGVQPGRLVGRLVGDVEVGDLAAVALEDEHVGGLDALVHQRGLCLGVQVLQAAGGAQRDAHALRPREQGERVGRDLGLGSLLA